jgi:hypothetical protein
MSCGLHKYKIVIPGNVFERLHPHLCTHGEEIRSLESLNLDAYKGKDSQR